MTSPPSVSGYDVIGVAAHPDDLEAVMGGTAAKLAAAGLRVLFVDLSTGEPTRHAPRGARSEQAARAANILGVDRIVLDFQDRCYESVFAGAQADLLDRYGAEDRYVGSLVGVRYAEAFKARGPLLVESPTVFRRVRFG